jgi:hypothetical protein
MSHDLTADRKTYWISHDSDKIESGVLPEGGTLSTGMAHLETYASPLMQQTRLHRLRTNYQTALGEWLETLRLRDPVAKLADHRWRFETAGLDLPGGQRIQTSRESQAQITAVVNSLQMGLITEPVTYKLDSGWADLSADHVTALAQAVGAHVKACFRAERTVAAQLEALEDPTNADVTGLFEAAYLAEMTQ